MFLEETSSQDLLKLLEKVFVDESYNFKKVIRVKESRRDFSDEAE